MARRGKVNVSISADSSGLKRGVRNAEGDLGRLQRVGVSSSRGLSAGFKAAGGIIAGAAVADQIRQTIVAAQESEVSQRKLATQLKATGISYRAHAAEIDRVIQKTSQLAGLDDEDLQDAFTNIVRVTGNVSQSLKLTGLAADFARAKHMDVAKAGEIVGKVAGGNVGILSRYGITIDKGATATEALGALQQKFAGQAAAYGKTSAGAQDRFRVAVENLRESLGAKLLPIITKVTNKAATFVNQMQDGTGAGGRFADKLKEIADRIRPIAKFFADHPKLIAVAVAAWVTYRVAATAALAASRLRLIGMFTGLGPRAAAGGAVAGRSFGGAAAASAGTTFNRTAPGRFGKAAAGFTAAGTVLGVALGAAAALELVDQLRHTMARFYDSLRSKGGLQGAIGAIGKLGTELAAKVPVIGGRSLEQTLGNRPKPKPKRVRPSAGSQAAPDNRPRAHSSSVMAHAASAVSGPTAHAASQPHPGDIVAAIEGRADRIDRAHVPYLWGGGHGGRVNLSGGVIPMDCSGAVSAALGIDPRVSGDFVSWGSPGDGGNRGVTIYANRTHVLMKINGRFWGTSRSNPGGGPGWIEGGVPGGYLSGFTARHMAGSTAVTGGTAAGGRPRRPTHLSAGLVGRGGSRVAPKGMGGAAIGRRGTQGASFYDPADRPIGGAAEFEYGTALNANEAAVAEQRGDPNAQRVAANKRRFQIATRINVIDQALKNPRHSAAYRTRLLTERASLVGELNQLGAVGSIPGADTTSGGPGGPADTAAADTGPDPRDEQITQLEALNQRMQELLDLQKAARDETQRALNVSQSQYGTLAKAITDVVSGQIGGRIGLGFMTPSYAGGVARP